MISKMFQTKWCPSSLDLKMNSSTCQALHTMTYLSIRSKQTCFGTWNTICPDLLMGTMLLRRISSRVSIHFSCRVDSLSITRGRTPSNQYLEEKKISWLREQSKLLYHCYSINFINILIKSNGPLSARCDPYCCRGFSIGMDNKRSVRHCMACFLTERAGSLHLSTNTFKSWNRSDCGLLQTFKFQEMPFEQSSTQQLERILLYWNIPSPQVHRDVSLSPSLQSLMISKYYRKYPTCWRTKLWTKYVM